MASAGGMAARPPSNLLVIALVAETAAQQQGDHILGRRRQNRTRYGLLLSRLETPDQTSSGVEQCSVATFQLTVQLKTFSPTLKYG